MREGAALEQERRAPVTVGRGTPEANVPEETVARRSEDAVPAAMGGWMALGLAVILVGLALGRLLVGDEPIEGDPDLMYRPFKTELARALRAGTLPFWSKQLGVGVPLVAESHVAAFYPLNLLIYRVLDVSMAYRLLMWLHYVALALTMYLYARVLRLTPWGAAMAATAFSLCGFQMSHACHEPFYSVMPYLPLALLLTERYLAVGGVWRLAALALVLGLQITLGHFQIQMWTAGLVVATGLWRVVARDAPWRRLAGLALALLWAGAVAMVQLGLTWELMHISRFNRPKISLTVYAFPPAHWAQPALPRLFQGFVGNTLSPYWSRLQTTPDEASFYIGTVPLILAAVGLVLRGDRVLAPWKWLALIGFLLATMPRWFLGGYYALLSLPGLGHFRAPGRFVLWPSLGLCLLAGRGFERAIASRRFWRGYGLAVFFGVLAAAWGVFWSSSPDVLKELGASARNAFLAEAAVAWLVGLAVVALWRIGPRTIPHGVPLLVAFGELTYLFYHGSTPWGRPIRFPERSPVFRRLAAERDVGLIAGRVLDLPVRAGFATAYPNLGITPPPPNYILESARDAIWYTDEMDTWFHRFGVTHGIFEGIKLLRPSRILYVGPDPALDALLPRTHASPNTRRIWRLERYPAFPEARAACVVREAESWGDLIDTLTDSSNSREVWYLKSDRPPDPPGPRARSARVLDWDGRSCVVEHDGTVDLVIRRAHYPGWSARLSDGHEVPIVPADGGLQSVRLPGSGRTRVEFAYHPSHLTELALISIAAATASVLVLFGAAVRHGSRPSRDRSSD